MQLSLPNLKACYCDNLVLQGQILLSDKMVSEIKKEPLTLSYRYSRDRIPHELSIYAFLPERKEWGRLLIKCRPVSSRGKRRHITLKDVRSLIEETGRVQKRPVNFTAFVDFKYPKTKVITPLPIKLSPSGKTEVELCGIRIRSSGPLQSLIIDTFPQKVVHVNAIIGISRKLSLNLINDALERANKISSQFLEVKEQ